MLPDAESKTAGGTSELTLLTPIKKGIVPGGAPQTYLERLRFILWTVDQRIQKKISTPVQMVGTIHFARWAILPAVDPQLPYAGQLLFISDFDGSVRSYLRDFAEKIGPDIDKIWENCVGYPEAGTKNFDEWWDYAKRHQVQCQAFYCAYPSVTVRDVMHGLWLKKKLDRFWRDKTAREPQSAWEANDFARLMSKLLTFSKEPRS